MEFESICKRRTDKEVELSHLTRYQQHCERTESGEKVLNNIDEKESATRLQPRRSFSVTHVCAWSYDDKIL